jgi:hypothetical protein
MIEIHITSLNSFDYELDTEFEIINDTKFYCFECGKMVNESIRSNCFKCTPDDSKDKDVA